MKKLLILIILFSICPLFGQESEIERLLIKGNDAYENSDFQNAKINYESIIKIDSTNKDAVAFPKNVALPFLGHLLIQ